jgi:hypothetical protein
MVTPGTTITTVTTIGIANCCYSPALWINQGRGPTLQPTKTQLPATITQGTLARLNGRSDGGFDRSWRRALFPSGPAFTSGGPALPQRDMPQLRACRSQLSLRSYFARRSVGTIVSISSPRYLKTRRCRSQCRGILLSRSASGLRLVIRFVILSLALLSYCAGNLSEP